ncbi:MAG TPA: molybdopterin-dependent oxidoreductase, partial [Modicisalibacter sp.]|nr:molybdopterin-dependent oxidoreductase [Modicisalibacter sp.]
AIDRITRFWQTEALTPRLPEEPGHKAIELFDAIGRGEIKALWIMATNPGVSLPDANRVRRILDACPLVIVSECMANADILPYADIVLPASSWSEKDGTVTNAERRISRQRGILPPPGEARHDWWIITQVARKLGFSDAFAYAHPSEIFDEHARLSGFANEESTRLFDISGLAGLDRAAYDAMAPIQWPVNVAAPNGTARLFTDGRFATPDGRARLIAVRPRGPQQPLSASRQLRLNTGRVRDQWHTMTRTARAPRLMSHRAEPFIEVHPEDAKRHGVEDQQLARLDGAGGEYIGRVRVSNAMRRGEVFVPMHWNDSFSGRALMGGLLAAHVDPVSGQPESKHGAVSLKPLAVGWQATLLIAADADGEAPWRDESAYWARIPLTHCQRWQLAGSDCQRDWLAWASANLPGEPTLWAEDATSGRLRLAGLTNGRLCWWLMVAAPTELPALHWLDERFAEAATGKALPSDLRRRLLAGCTAGETDTGPTVCSCHQVGQQAIVEAIRGGDISIEALGARLACGTQCGSCIPELKSLIEEETAHAGSDKALETEAV